MADSPWGNVCTESNACALTGAIAFFAAVTDAAIVVNGPLWCASYARRYLEMQSPFLHSRFFCTQADNEAVVYGTESCLTATLQQVKKQLNPGVVLIVNNCSIGLIGDDIEGIAREAGLPCPVVCLDGGGLSGSFREGYLAAATAFLARAPLEQRRQVRPATVNILGCSVGYYNERNDIAELCRILNRVGVEVLHAPGLYGTAGSLNGMTQAALNVVVHEELGGGAARWLRDCHAMPYVSLLPPYGITDSLVWAKEILHHLDEPVSKLTGLQREADACRQAVSASVAEMERIWNCLWFERAVVAAPPSVASGVARALRSEWADVGHLTLLCHGGVFAGTELSLADEVIDARTQGDAGDAAVSKLAGGLLLASNTETYRMMSGGIKPACRQNIAMPVYDELLLPGRPFVGLRGNGNLLTSLWNGSINERRGC